MILIYQESKTKQLMGNAYYAPFNEAMGVIKTSPIVIFNTNFIRTRAEGHQATELSYINTVINPLEEFFKQKYDAIVLWFGEDVFCQMNLRTILAYLERSNYGERYIYLNSFRKDEFKINQRELTLGIYYTIYLGVLVNYKKPSVEVLLAMY